MYKIPNTNKKFAQTNRSNVLGNIWSSFNLDLGSNKGRIRVSPRLATNTFSLDQADLLTPLAFVSYRNGGNTKIWAMADNYMWNNSGNVDDSFYKDATSGTPTTTERGDLALFNNCIYTIASNSDIVKYDGTSWSTVTTSLSVPETIFCQYASRLYGTTQGDWVYSIDTSDVISIPTASSSNSVPYTLNLNYYGTGGYSANEITAMVASSNRIWIGTSDRTSSFQSTGRKSFIFEWDGVSNQATRVYNIDSQGIIAMIVKDDIPYAVDIDGRLLRYNGSSFTEVARFPVKPYQYLINPLGSIDEKFMHHNGMTIRDGKILILISNYIEAGGSITENMPSGVWEYDEEIGLYHRYSISINGAGSLTDYGQNRIFRVGALFAAKQPDSSDTNGDLLAGAATYNDSSDSGNYYGIFYSDTESTKNKSGYFVTPQIESENIEDLWQKAYIKYKKFLDVADKIDLKYRTDDPNPIYANVTWTSSTTFTTTTDISSVQIGYEVEGIQADSSGQCFHITNIVNTSGTYTVTLDTAAIRAFGTSKVRFQNWTKLGTANIYGTQFKEFSIGKNSTWIQLKCVMFFNGDDEVQELQIINKTHLPSA